MPEGDTIHRSALSLRRWLGGRAVTRVQGSRWLAFDPGVLVGTTVDDVEAQGKHLLMTFSSGLVLHTHMRMTGSWHVYPAGERWRKPAHQARLVLEVGSRLAVCFNAPVVELRTERSLPADPVLARLGPDVLGPAEVELGELAARVAARAGRSPTIGELLLDQQVVSGIGNIYRCETLFLCGLDPRARTVDVPLETVRELVATASRLMGTNARSSAIARRFDAPPERTWVYRRAGRPCRRCGATVASRPIGEQGRLAYWCPGCQLGPVPGGSASEPDR